MGVVVLPDNERPRSHLPHRRPPLPRRGLRAEHLPEETNLPLRLPLGLEHRHRPPGSASRLVGPRYARHKDGERILEDRHRLALPHCGDEMPHLLRAEGRRLNREQDVVFLGDRRRGIDLDDVVLLLELVDDRLPGPLLAGHHVDAAEQIGVGREHAEALAPLVAHGGDRADQLILDRRALVEERHDDLLEAAGEGTAEEDVLVAVRAADPRTNLDRLDAELLPGQGRGIGLRLGRHHLDVHLATAESLELPEHVEERQPRLGVFLGDARADVGGDLHGARGIELRQELARIGRERADLLRGKVVADIHRPAGEHRPQRHSSQPQRPQCEMDSELGAVAAPGPVAAADEHHGDVEGNGHDPEEEYDRRHADDPAAEIGEVLRQAPGPDPIGHLRIHDRHRLIGDGERRVEDQPEDEGDGEVAGEEARHHPDGEHRQPDKPVAEVVGEEQASVGGAPAQQDDEIADAGEHQGDGVDPDRGEILAKHHLPVARRDRQQQLVGPLTALVRPHAHRDRRDEDEEDEGEVAVELVEIGEVGVEKFGGPERRQRPEQHEHTDENVAGGTGKVGDEVPLEHRVDNVPVHDASPDLLLNGSVECR